jgi:hypothetical protein
MIFLMTLLKAVIAALMFPIALGLGAFIGIVCFLIVWLDVVYKRVITDDSK